jgi:sugar transferase EpsL
MKTYWKCVGVMAYRTSKRLLDIIVSLAGLVLLAPLFALIAAAILSTTGGRVLFRQTRPGLCGKPFVIYKFRSMSETRGPDEQLLADAERLTRVGNFLRRLSLDELPQLWNVLRGDMSLVGPRPMLMEDLPYYTPEEARRHDLKPGITGWAQVHGRNETEWEQKVKYDLWYVDHASLWLDFKILLLTVGCVLRPKGITGEGEKTVSVLRTQTAQGAALVPRVAEWNRGPTAVSDSALPAGDCHAGTRYSTQARHE